MAGRGTREAIVWLYALDLSLFMAHEIDSGYWQEWRLFGLPSAGPGLFVLIHVPLLILFLLGFRDLLGGWGGGRWWSLLLAAIGIAALFIHGGFIATGHPEFRSGASLTLIVTMFVTSVALAAVTLRAMLSGPSVPA